MFAICLLVSKADPWAVKVNNHCLSICGTNLFWIYLCVSGPWQRKTIWSEPLKYSAWVQIHLTWYTSWLTAHLLDQSSTNTPWAPGVSGFRFWRQWWLKMLQSSWMADPCDSHTPSQSFLTLSPDSVIVIALREHSECVIVMHVSNSCTCSALRLLPAT